LKPEEKELVFDVDLTDYDDVRTCCSKADICELCWKYVVLAVKIVDRILKGKCTIAVAFLSQEDFGFKSLLWVYSGRRGVHCWVSDYRARRLDDEKRRAILNYIDVVKGGDNQDKKVNLLAVLHPHLEKARSIMKEEFKQILFEDQDILSDPIKSEKLLDILSNTQLKSKILDEWKYMTDSKEKWDYCLKSVAESQKEAKAKQFENEVLFQHLYPRLDVKVSIQINHLLKSPFCVHPKTGKICCPFRAEECSSFNPLTVPTVLSLYKEINECPEEKQASG
jgi:DNA primase small subunit